MPSEAKTVRNGRVLQPNQVARVMIGHVDGRPPELVLQSDSILLEAPNWTLDGGELVLNGDGQMWRLPIESGSLTPIAFTDLPNVNNDHVLDPSGQTLFMSTNDGHIHSGPLAGGTPARVTSDHEPARWQFLHGISPDGGTLAYIGLERTPDGQTTANVFTLQLADGTEHQLTFGDKHADGCEYSPDGSWIYLNTEAFSTTPGHAQLARMRTDGSDLEQLTFDERVNWFPHVSPDGNKLLWLSYEPGTTGHPADRTVRLHLASDIDAIAGAQLVAELPGGQGTINVNSWAPDSTRFAYVEYPFLG